MLCQLQIRRQCQDDYQHGDRQYSTEQIDIVQGAGERLDHTSVDAVARTGTQRLDDIGAASGGVAGEAEIQDAAEDRTAE